MQEGMLEDPENVEMFVEVATSLLEPRKNAYVKRCARSEVERAPCLTVMLSPMDVYTCTCAQHVPHIFYFMRRRTYMHKYHVWRK